MKIIQEKFIHYLKMLIKEWAFWIFLVMDGLGVFLSLIDTTIKIPSFIFWLIALLCILWAGFKVYQKTLDQIVSGQITNIPLPKPKIHAEFVEGNEYVYSLIANGRTNGTIYQFTPKTSKDILDDIAEEEFLLPACDVEFHIRLRNESPVNARIINIKCDFLGSYFLDSSRKKESNGIWAMLALTSVKTVDVENSDYPIVINRNEILPFDLSSSFKFSTHYNPAEFAAEIASIPKKIDNPYLTVEVKVQDIVSGDVLEFKTKKEISLIPLKEKYIAHWQWLGEEGLLEVANLVNHIV